MSDKWDQFFLKLAREVSRKSKDPSTKVGAVIAEDKRFVSMGFNGFPAGVQDLPERYADRQMKYQMVTHAEANALLFAKRDLTGCTLYTFPFQPCSTCAGLIIQSGIKRCVAPPMSEELRSRWGESLRLAELMFREAGVQLDLMEIEG